MNRHLIITKDQHDIAWLQVDKADSSANVLTAELLEEFDQSLVQIAQMHPKGLVIISGKASGFIAGADVKAFADVPGVASAEQHIQRVHEILHRLESMAFPTVAAIHGFCLGGGLELALACDYRVGADDDATRLGFPEVKLGIFPGYGGTVRSTRLLGDLAGCGQRRREIVQERGGDVVTELLAHGRAAELEARDVPVGRVVREVGRRGDGRPLAAVRGRERTAIDRPVLRQDDAQHAAVVERIAVALGHRLGFGGRGGGLLRGGNRCLGAQIGDVAADRCRHLRLFGRGARTTGEQGCGRDRGGGDQGETGAAHGVSRRVA